MLMVATMFIALSATAQTWDGSVATGYAGGEGSKGNPYQISTPQEFAYFAQQMAQAASYSEGKYFVLTNDLVFNENVLTTEGKLNGTPQKCPMVGAFETDRVYVPFTGHFDGQGHVIKGFYAAESKNHVSLFRWTEGAVIKNLGVVDAYISGNSYSGIIVGRQMKGTKIINCWVYGSTFGPDNNETGGSNHAGISGWCFDDSEIVNCYNAGGYITGKNNFGGITGRIGNTSSDNVGAVKNCYSITNIKDSSRGVICATVDGGSVVSHCYGFGAAKIANAGFGTVESSEIKTEEEMKSDEMIALLNSQYDYLDAVCKWVKGPDGYPVHDYSTCKEETGGLDYDAMATEPTPGNMAANVDGDDNTTTLSWKIAANGLTTAQRLYLSNDELSLDDNLVAELGTETSCTVNVPSAKTYYWRVDQIQADGKVTKGLVWSFTCRLLAFPGADGGGKYTTGGRGGKVIHVTNLNDSGEGSLRSAINQSGARTIVFDVAGTIELNSTLRIGSGNVTIAGQTAPGDGICLKNYPLNISASNVIVRYIRCRMGDEKQTEDDAMNCFSGSINYSNIIIDHCSISWSTDECASFYGVKDFSFQWNIVSEPLTKSVHDKGSHGYGGIWGGQNASFHHNLIAHSNSRNPRFDHYYVNQSMGLMDFTNNVVYNWGSNNAYGGESSNANALRYINFVGNYYKPGPASGRRDQLFNLTNSCSNCMGTSGHGSAVLPAKVYLTGNILEGSESVTADNWKGIKPDVTITDWSICKSENAFDVTPLAEVQTAEDAYASVLDGVGASLHRDAVDQRVISDARTGEATCMDGGNGSKNGIIDTQAAVGGWPELKATAEELAVVAEDTNANGIPDSIEQTLFGGLVDGNGNDKDQRMTNLEYYLAWIIDSNLPSAIDVIEYKANTSTGRAYNLAGQRVNANAKGLVILDGKKYFNK